MGTTNTFKITYRPQTNGQAERIIRSLLSMLHFYVNEHQSHWDEYRLWLCYAYKNAVHRSSGTTPFDLVVSGPPPHLATDLVRT